jgi:uncharacterized protein (TIGR02598 family)
MPSSLPSPPNKSRQGFSLIEIVLSIGIASFALITILGLIPVGMNTLSESVAQTAVANISNQLRGEFQQISFSTNAAFNIQHLKSTSYYYTHDGFKSNQQGCYYEAKFDLSNGKVGGASFDTSTAQSIKVTLTYPFDAPAAGKKTIVFSLFAARNSDQ